MPVFMGMTTKTSEKRIGIVDLFNCRSNNIFSTLLFREVLKKMGLKEDTPTFDKWGEALKKKIVTTLDAKREKTMQEVAKKQQEKQTE